MSTIMSWQIVAQMMTHDGAVPGDPPASTIWEYYNPSSTTQAYAVYYNEREMPFGAFVLNHRLLWSRWDGISAYGREWLQNKGVRS